MGRQESIISAGPAGAGRKRDFAWPDWHSFNTGSSILERDRPGGTNTQSGSISTGTTGAVVAGTINGVPCMRLTNGANLNGGPNYIFDGGGRLTPTTLRTNVKFSSATDDFSVWRVYAMMRVPATPGDATDIGMEIVLGGNAGSGVLKDSVPGWAIQFDNTGGCSLVQHGNSGAQTAVVIQSVAQGFVNTDFHMFEIRLIGATPNADGAFKVLLNGVPKIQRSFTGPDDLPIPSSAGANVNNAYVVNFQCASRNSEVDIAIARVQCAPTEMALF